ncbi:hypothetical protein [Fulvivirga sedimenti]|uniref:Bacterial surface antigen (D15) domain-containing protein n=1 Tax=Fulvivirga sedimenti TaxID=2879465 RepID=A0A9X1HVQ0_9BACT|nr:hypothetical protein [Fulvivirga sedimenti]MCA6074817.1 hypothetical protein [Fulvivirga sedimenti]MCA6075994.1 hypothetical protein [Fulvivirga sedimenti]MCA6077122.1 hypothetical protein [Fulvivirga sedimenti]
MKCRLILFLLMWALALIPVFSYGQADTIRLPMNKILVLPDSVYIPDRDTVFIVPEGFKYRIKPNPYFKSQNFYEKLRNNKEKSALSRELYDLVIRDTTYNVLDKTKPVRAEAYFRDFRGMRINSIRHYPVQLITGSVTDTLRESSNSFIDKLDESHIDTRTRLVRNNVLFTEGDLLDPFRMADSERILRLFEYINDARIYVLPSIDNEGSVDVIIVTQDRFPWGLDLDISSLSKFEIGLSQRNILGTGNELSAGFIRNKNDEPQNGYVVQYVSAPYKNTFTNLTLTAENSYIREYYSVKAEKNNISPVIKYAGSLELATLSRDFNFAIEDSTYENYLSLNYADIFLGRAFQTFSDDRKTVNIALRNVYVDFSDRPTVESDSNTIFYNRNTLIGTFDIRKTNFIKTTNVVSIGITEDLPVGYYIGASLGGNFDEFKNQVYTGMRWQWSNYLKFGYIYLRSELGTFFNSKEFSDGMWVNEFAYMTQLFKLRRSTFRSFARFNYIRGINLSLPVSARLRDYIRGLKGYYTQGNEAIALNFESVWFTPWYWYGFRFAPFFTLDIGYVSEDRVSTSYKELYPALGTGFRITNPGLFLSSFEIGVKYFTNTPPDGNTIYFNLSVSQRLRFNYNTTVKPDVLPYRAYKFL